MIMTWSGEGLLQALYYIEAPLARRFLGALTKVFSMGDLALMRAQGMGASLGYL